MTTPPALITRFIPLGCACAFALLGWRIDPLHQPHASHSVLASRAAR